MQARRHHSGAPLRGRVCVLYSNEMETCTPIAGAASCMCCVQLPPHQSSCLTYGYRETHFSALQRSYERAETIGQCLPSRRARPWPAWPSACAACAWLACSRGALRAGGSAAAASSQDHPQRGTYSSTPSYAPKVTHENSSRQAGPIQDSPLQSQDAVNSPCVKHALQQLG